MAKRPTPTPPTTVAPPSPRPKPRNLKAASLGGIRSLAPPEPPPASGPFTVAIPAIEKSNAAVTAVSKPSLPIPPPNAPSQTYRSMAQSAVNCADDATSGIDTNAMDISDIRSKFENAAIQERRNSTASTTSPRNPHRASFKSSAHNYTLTVSPTARSTAITPAVAAETSFAASTTKSMLPKSAVNSILNRASTCSEGTETGTAELSKLKTFTDLEGAENPFLTCAEGGEAEEATGIEVAGVVQPSVMAQVNLSVSSSTADFAASSMDTNLSPVKTVPSRPPTTYLTRSPSPTKTSYVNTISATSTVLQQTGKNLTTSLTGILQTDAGMKKTARKSYVGPKILGGGIRHSNSSGSLTQISPSAQNEKRQLRRNSSDGGVFASQNRNGAASRPVSSPIEHGSAQIAEPELTADELRKKMQKRKAAVREFVISEHSYWMDMTAILDCCYLPAKEMVSAQTFMERDVKTLFSNIPAITNFSGDFAKLLSTAGGVPLALTSEQESLALRTAKSVSSLSVSSENSIQNESKTHHVSEINITVSSDSLDLDSNATDETMFDDWIGEAFLQNSAQISVLYAEYCSRHESAVVRLQEMENGGGSDEDAKGGNAIVMAQMQWLKDCVTRMKGRTNAWDLGSLIIKPVQRVLKYPLLLQAILKETPRTHPDYGALKDAVAEAQKVADHVNEIKKRKDLVEQITGVKKKDVDIVRGINKKWTRAGQQLKQVTGMGGDVTVDPVYEALVERMEIMEQQTRQFAKDVASWIRLVKEYIDVQENVAKSFEELYTFCPNGMSLSDNPKRSLEMAEYKKCVGVMMLNCWKELDKKVKEQIYHALEKFLALRASIDIVIQKRGKKLLDYTRAQSIKARGDTPDKALQESANAYLSIHAQLLDELPKFIGFGIQYLDAVLCRLAKLQGEFYHEECLSLTLLAQQMAISRHDMTKGAVVEAYARRMEDENVHEVIQNLRITRWRKEQPISRGSSFRDRQRSISMMDLGSHGDSAPGSPHEEWQPPTSELNASPRRRERSLTVGVGVPVGTLIPFDADPFADPVTGPESLLDYRTQPSKPSEEFKSTSHSKAATPSTYRTSSIYSTNSSTSQHEPGFDIFAHSKPLSRTNSRTDRSNGRKPSFPMHSIPIDEPPLFSAVVVRGNFPEDPSQLRLVEGDIVNVREVDNYKRTDLRSGGSGWWFGENIETGAAGYFPKNCCVKME